MTKRLSAASNSHLKARSLSLSCSLFAFACTTGLFKSSRCSIVDSNRARSRNVSYFATCQFRTEAESSLHLLSLSPLPRRLVCKPAPPHTHCNTAIPVVDYEYCPPTTNLDPISASLDSRLGFYRVQCAVFRRCTSLVHLADKS